MPEGLRTSVYVSVSLRLVVLDDFFGDPSRGLGSTSVGDDVTETCVAFAGKMIIGLTCGVGGLTTIDARLRPGSSAAEMAEEGAYAVRLVLESE